MRLYVGSVIAAVIDLTVITAGAQGNGGNGGNNGSGVEAGVVDPTKVICVALESAVSVGGMLLLSHSILGAKIAADRPGPQPPTAPPPAAVKERVVRDLPAVSAASSLATSFDAALDELDARFNAAERVELEQFTMAQFADDLAAMRAGS